MFKAFLSCYRREPEPLQVRALQEAGAVAVTAAVEAAESLESLQTSRSKGPSKPLVFEPAVRAVPRAAPTSAEDSALTCDTTVRRMLRTKERRRHSIIDN